MEEKIGEYKVRRVGKNGEQIIHVPATITGRFTLYLEDNGTLHYVPMKPGIRETS